MSSWFDRWQSHSNALELVIVIETVVAYLVASTTHVNFHYRILFCVLASGSILVLHAIPRITSRISKFGQVLLVPLILTFAALGAFHAVAHNMPSLAFGHPFMDYDTQVPEVRVSEGALSNPSISVVIPVRDERTEYLTQTLVHLVKETPAYLLKEVIVVDDFSDFTVMESDLNSGNPFIASLVRDGKLKIIRLPARQGLIVAKTTGADSAIGSHILFLDAHCKVGPGYAERMLYRSSIGTYKDIIVAQIIDVINSPAKGFYFRIMDGGSKMMFDWTFDFNWFADDSNDNVPVSSGGIMLMTRRRWTETKYDTGMLGWGGENLEQSFMNWVCGGKIIVEREARIGHIFDRPARSKKMLVGDSGVSDSNAPTQQGVSQPRLNYARGAYVWLDDWLEYFEYYAGHNVMKDLLLSNLNLESFGYANNANSLLDIRLELRHRLQCTSFTNGYVDWFKTVFDDRSLFAQNEMAIQHVRSGYCLTVMQSDTSINGNKWKDGKTPLKMKDIPVNIVWSPCSPYEQAQRFTKIRNNSMIRSVKYQRCLERDHNESVKLNYCDPQSETQFFTLRDNLLVHGTSVESGSLENRVQQRFRSSAMCVSAPIIDRENQLPVVLYKKCASEFIEREPSDVPINYIASIFPGF